jgi:glycosyltransferase involved in cell wall biosynthesis
MESVFAQNYRPVEIVVLDDGSADNTPELMKSFGSRIRYYWQENSGIAVARTKACRLARGEFIAFQDDDDLMPPDRISQLYEGICRYPSAVLALGDWAVIDADGILTGERSRVNIKVNDEEPVLLRDGYKAVLWPEVTATPHTSLFRRADGERIGWFDTRFSHACEDTDFFARLGRLGPIFYVPKVVSYYRKGHSQYTSKKLLLACSRFMLFEKHLMALEPEQTVLRERLQKRMLTTLKRIAFCTTKGVKLPDSVSKDRMKDSLSLLEFKERLEYRWFTLFKLPLRRVFYGAN